MGMRYPKNSWAGVERRLKSGAIGRMHPVVLYGQPGEDGDRYQVEQVGIGIWAVDDAEHRRTEQELDLEHLLPPGVRAKALGRLIEPLAAAREKIIRKALQFYLLLDQMRLCRLLVRSPSASPQQSAASRQPGDAGEQEQ